MATTLGTLRTAARIHLNETTARFWTDAELLDYAIKGVQDLWKALVDLHQEHFLTDDASNVSVAANATTLTGVPADCFRVHMIEPRDLSGSARYLKFEAKDYNHVDFQEARAQTAVDPSGGPVVLFALVGAGAPVAAPTVKVAPKLTAAVNLRFVYIPTLASMTADSSNPIPGESDNAIIAWIVAWARAKEREDRTPDPEWLALYATEKTGLKIINTPRQSQDPEIVDGMFEGYF